MDVTLERWDPRFIGDVAHFGNSRSIADNLRDGFPYPYTYADAERFVVSCAENDERRQVCRAIVADGRAVGSVGIFLGGDVYHKTAEVGYWLAEAYRGRGIMPAAVKELCGYAFANYDLVRIQAEPFAHNAASRRVLEKAGFQLEGIMRKRVCKHGAVFDSCMYALFQE